MSRGTWIAVVLVVVTNAVWAAAWLGTSTPGNEADTTRDATRAELEEEIESLRARDERPTTSGSSPVASAL